MELNARNWVLIASIIATALSAGLFYAWVISVIPGTRKISDQAYLETMQSINREILNPGFFLIFFGALILLIISTYLHFRIQVDTVFYLILGATLCYGLGTMGTTMFGNVPLNNSLEALDISSFTEKDFKNARDAYEQKWNNLNLIRTIAALISFVFILFALVKK